MDLCYIESEKSRFSNNKIMQNAIAVKNSVTILMSVVPPPHPRLAPRDTLRNSGPNAKKGNGRGYDVVAKLQQRGRTPKNSRGQ